MAINSYDALVSAVIAVAEDDSAEFALYIPQAIDLAETRMAREMDTLGIVQTAVVTAQSSIATVTKPSGYKNGQDLIYTNASTGSRTVMKKRTYSFIQDYWPVSASVGNPIYYADIDVSTFIVAPTPNTSIAFNLRYEGRPLALTSANQTNYFVEQCPDALFFSTMTEMYRFARNTALEQQYEQQYANARDSLLNEARRSRADNSGKPGNASTNTLKGDI